MPALSWLGTKIGTAVAAGLLALTIAFGVYGWFQYQRAERWQDRSALEASNHRQTKSEYRLAQAVAGERARLARLETERRSAQLAKEADNANEDAALWRDAAARYAALGGLRNQTRAAVDSAPGRPGAAGGSDVSGRANEAGSDAVLLSRADFDILTENTGRLIRGVGFVNSMIDAGLGRRVGDALDPVDAPAPSE